MSVGAGIAIAGIWLAVALAAAGVALRDAGAAVVIGGIGFFFALLATMACVGIK